MENSVYILTPRERVERLAVGGFVALTTYILTVTLIGKHAPAWSALFLFFPFLGAVSCFLQAGSHLCGFRGLFSPVSRGKALILWGKAAGGAFLLSGAVFFILSKGLFTHYPE